MFYSEVQFNLLSIESTQSEPWFLLSNGLSRIMQFDIYSWMKFNFCIIRMPSFLFHCFFNSCWQLCPVRNWTSSGLFSASDVLFDFHLGRQRTLLNSSNLIFYYMVSVCLRSIGSTYLFFISGIISLFWYYYWFFLLWFKLFVIYCFVGCPRLKLH